MSGVPIELGAPIGTNTATTGNTGENDISGRMTEPAHPPLEHTRTAPTTVPVASVAHQQHTAADPARRQSRHDSEGSSTPTLNTDVPLTAGGVHGQPMPGSKARDGVVDEKDHAAGTTGGAAGTDLATRAKHDLHIETDTFDEKKRHGPPSPSAEKRLERTRSGTQVPRSAHTATGHDTVTGLGMVPITRKQSQPPAVSPFGGVAPDGVDAEEGLGPVRSHEEEEEREIMRQAKGVDPWAVKFEEGEKTNPKVSSIRGMVDAVLLMSELGCQLSMVPHRRGRVARPQFDVRIVLAVGNRPRHDCLL